MAVLSVFARAKRSIVRFGRSQDGSIVPLFAFSLVTLLSLVGAATDYARMNNARTAMQAALDSASLMISKDAAAANPAMTQADIQTRAQAYFNALFNNGYTSTSPITAIYTPPTSGSTATIQLTVTGTMQTELLRLANIKKFDFYLSSTATWGSARMRVALALDNTGSMQNAGKMTALKTAAKALIDQLSATAKVNGDVYISIVPFATDVNIGTGFRTSSTMDWSNWSPTGSIEDVNNNWKCGAKYQAPSWSNNYSGTMVCGSAANDTSKWNGCVMDRAQNYDTTNDAPATGVTGTWLAADQSPWCPTQMMPLSYNWTNLKAKIDAMSPSGATNQPIGLQWAWFSLSQTAPLNAPAQDPNYKYNNILILMSDGLNTLDRWYGDGSTPNTSVDARQKILCDNIKKAGVTIYTILVNTDGDPPSTVMPYCASGQSNYFPTTSATDMQTAFATIGASLTKLRIAQ